MKKEQDILLATKVGNKIANLRNSLNLSQEKLSEHIGISQKALSKIENGNSFPRPATIEKIADFFNIEVKDIFIFSTNEDKNKIIKNIKNKIDLIKTDARKLKAVDMFLNNII